MDREVAGKARQYIQGNQLLKAAQVLLEDLQNVDSSYLNEMLIYMADIKRLEKDQRIRIESTNDIRREKNRITNAILQLIEELEKEPQHKKNGIVYISYAWEKESEQIAESFELAAKQAGLETVRDKTNGVLYKGNINEFMQLLGTGKCIVIIISDKYLKSHNCMYEILKIKENNNLLERVFPIILNNTNIYDPVKRIKYVQYWQEKWRILNDSLKRLDDLSAIDKSQKDLKLYADIKNVINEITDTFSNINSLTADFHVKENFKTIIESIYKL